MRSFAVMTSFEFAQKINDLIEKIYPALNIDHDEISTNGGRMILGDAEENLSLILGNGTDAIPEISKMFKDISEIQFDFENVMITPTDLSHLSKDIQTFCGIKTLNNGMPYAGVYAGGDWECPVFSIVYHDGATLRAYIPKQGNTFNPLTNKAFGNDELQDEAYAANMGISLETLSQNDFEAVDEMIKDIEKNIVQKSSGHPWRPK